jgi:hypothetical protein
MDNHEYSLIHLIACAFNSTCFADLI